MSLRLEEVKRHSYEKIFQEILGRKRVRLEMVSGSVSVFRCELEKPRKLEIFGDIFSAETIFEELKSNFSTEFRSLEKIVFGSSQVSSAEVILSLQIETLRSSSFYEIKNLDLGFLPVSLRALQFYINAEESFLKLRWLYSDATSRNRQDVKSNYVYKMCKICEINTYEAP